MGSQVHSHAGENFEKEKPKRAAARLDILGCLSQCRTFDSGQCCEGRAALMSRVNSLGDGEALTYKTASRFEKIAYELKGKRSER